jgi:hypothetical protein
MSHPHPSAIYVDVRAGVRAKLDVSPMPHRHRCLPRLDAPPVPKHRRRLP